MIKFQKKYNLRHKNRGEVEGRVHTRASSSEKSRVYKKIESNDAEPEYLTEIAIFFVSFCCSRYCACMRLVSSLTANVGAYADGAKATTSGE